MIIALILLTGNGVTVTVTLDILHTDYRFGFFLGCGGALLLGRLHLLHGLVVSFPFISS